MNGMIKGVLRRFGTLLLALVLSISSVPAFPLTAFAATSGTLTGLLDSNIGLSYSGSADDAWSVGGTTINGSVTSKSGTCGDTDYNSTLTITNNKSTSALLSFDYSVALNSGTVQIDEDSKTSSGSYSGTVEAGKSIKVYIKSGSTTATKVELTNIALVADVDATTTFQPAENGSYTVDGTTVTTEFSKTQSATKAYKLVATPADGYQFMGWYNVATGACISNSATASVKVESDCTITARFVKNGTALFETGGQMFADLDEAVQYAQSNAQSKITLVSDGVLEGSHTIPSGITLLIPNDSSSTLHTETPAAFEGDKGTKAAYRTLTMADGASLNVNGALSVSGWYKAAAGSATGYMTGAYGLISMAGSSSITINSNAKLYCWGFITGSGNVTVKSGGNVMEWFQITDFRGGLATMGMGNKVFPISQYYIQNVEVAMTLEAGAVETGYTAVYAMSKMNTSAIPLIGDGGMFNIASGSLTKRYDGTSDRQMFTINGECSLSTLSLKLSGSTVDSASYVLPVTNNFSLNIESGKFTVSQTSALLPGVEVNIADGAEMEVASGASLYVYDYSEWGGYAGGYSQEHIAVNYAPSRTGNLTLADAKIDVNGTLTATGSIYTTASGANICSSQGTGKYVQSSKAGSETKTYQYTQSGSSVTAHEIAITPAQLRNADGSYYQTKEVTAGTTVPYADGEWGKVASEISITFDANGGEGTMDALKTGAGKDTALSKNTFTRTGYTFAGWNTAADGTGVAYADDATVNFSEDTTLYAQWTANTYTVTWVNADGSVLETDENVAYGTTPTYDGETPTKQGNAQYSYTFTGWTPEITTVTGDATYKATFEEVTNTYTITWQNYDGTVLDTDTVAYGETPQYTGTEPTRTADAQYTYAFSGWSPEISAVTGDASYTAQYNTTTKTYTVTWMNEDGTVLETDENVEYGTTPTYDGAVPTKASDGTYKYTFNGWTPEVSTVEGDATYTAKFASAPLEEYTVAFVDESGTASFEAQSVKEGQLVTLPEMTATRDGYNFKGWTTSQDGSGTVYAAAETLTPVRDTVFYAQWSGKSYGYNLYYSGDDNTALVYVSTSYGEQPVLPEQVKPSKTSDASGYYEFVGWEGTGSGVRYGKDDLPVANDANYAKDNAYRAVFVLHFDVTFEANADDATGKMDAQDVCQSTDTALNVNKFEREGYTFTGWNTQADGTGTFYADGATVNLSEKTTLYAQWSINKYAITWKNWDGTVLKVDSVGYGEVPSYDGAEPTREGDDSVAYKFKGWNPEIVKATENAEYTAEFSETKLATVTFDANGEGVTGEMAKQAIEAGTATALTKNAFEREGYTFKGWNTKADGTGDAYDDEAEVALSEPTILYAQWEAKKFTVVWVDEDGTELEKDENVAYGTMPSYDGEEPSKADDDDYSYSFAGWEPAVEAVKGDVTYKATYTKTALVKHKVTFNANGGEGTMDDQVFVQGKDTQLSENKFTREGYTFVNWNTAADGSGATYAADGSLISLTSDLTLYAQWQHDDGWFTDSNGKTYYKDGKQAYFSEWQTIDGATYYFDENGYVVTGIQELTKDGVEARYAFNEDGEFLTDTTGVYSSGENTYWLNSGVVDEFAGLKRVVTEAGEVNYYYFAEDGLAVKGQNDYKIEKNNDLKLPCVNYNFDENGVIEHDADTSKNGISAATGDTSGTKYYFIDGVKVGVGLIKIDGYFYYIRTSTAEVVTNRNYWVAQTNSYDIPAGFYKFDSEGRMLFGFVDQGGYTYYYNADGSLAKGFTKIGDDYYFFNAGSGKLYKNTKLWVGNNDYGVAAGTYEFDSEGKLVVKNGFIDEDNATYYYVNGEKTKGFTKIGDDYYFFNAGSGKLYKGVTLWVGTNSYGIEAGMYDFGADGKMVVSTKNGFVEEYGATYYYVDGEMVKGFTKIGDDYYLFNRSSGKMYKDGTYWVGINNEGAPYGIAAGMYVFGSDGKMVL